MSGKGPHARRRRNGNVNNPQELPNGPTHQLSDLPDDILDKIVAGGNFNGIRTLASSGGIRSDQVEQLRKRFIARKFGDMWKLISPTLMKIPQVIDSSTNQLRKLRTPPSRGRKRLWSWNEMLFLLPVGLRLFSLTTALIFEPRMVFKIDAGEDLSSSSDEIDETLYYDKSRGWLNYISYPEILRTTTNKSILDGDYVVQMMFDGGDIPLDLADHGRIIKFDNVAQAFPSDIIPVNLGVPDESGGKSEWRLKWTDKFGNQIDLGVMMQTAAYSHPAFYGEELQFYIEDFTKVANYLIHRPAKFDLFYYMLALPLSHQKYFVKVVHETSQDSWVLNEARKTAAINLKLLISLAAHDPHSECILNFFISLLMRDDEAATTCLKRLEENWPQFKQGEFDHVILNEPAFLHQ